MTSPPLLESAAEVWEHLLEEGGLQPTTWDEPLVDELRARLGLGEGSVAAELASQAVATEALVYALLETLEPFAAMMGDLLALFARHRIERSDGSAEMAFDFEALGRPPMRFDLESFRRARKVWSRVRTPTVELDWIQHWAWELVRLTSDTAGRGHWSEPRPATAGWLDAYMERGQWPPTALALPPSGSTELDREVARAARIWAAIVLLMRARAPNREALGEVARRSGDPEGVGEGRLLNLLWGIEHDYYVLTLASNLVDVADPQTRTRDGARLASDLRAFLDEHPFTGDPIETMVQSLLDVLDLPIWRQRHELYAAWVLAEIVAAAPVPARLIPAEPGVLRFPFRATPMAQLAPCDHEVIVWSEVRTPLTDPTGASRTGNVQPDYTIVVDAADPRSAPEASVLEVECKQYRRAANKSFVAALTDYAAARPGALVVLVNHGSLDRDRLLAAVPARLRHRTDAVGHLHPLDVMARERFHELVDGRLRPLCPGLGLHCRLEWDQPPADLDLHLFAASGFEQWHIYYDRPGAVDNRPFAALTEDVRHPGSVEELVIAEWIDGVVYVFGVHAFSDDAKLVGCGARVVLEQEGRPRIAVECPDSGQGRWWWVADLLAGGELRLLNEIREHAPL